MQHCPTCGYVYVKRMDLTIASLETYLANPELANLHAKDWVADINIEATIANWKNTIKTNNIQLERYWWCGMCNKVYQENPNTVDLTRESCKVINLERVANDGE